MVVSSFVLILVIDVLYVLYLNIYVVMNMQRITGGYSITTQVGKRTEAGTIPKELGRLSNWKYVVFGKSDMIDFHSFSN